MHPTVWRSAAAALNGIDTFLVLGTGPERSVRWGRTAAPHPTLLATALDALQPKRVRFVMRPQLGACNNPATAQFAKWALCVDLVRAHENTTGVKYDVLYKGRPDVAWVRPPDLRALAARVPPSVVLGGNDAHLFVRREQWRALVALAPGRLRCDQRCNGRSTPLLRHYFNGNNEYCLLTTAFAREGITHVEASHPTERWLLGATASHRRVARVAGRELAGGGAQRDCTRCGVGDRPTRCRRSSGEWHDGGGARGGGGALPSDGAAARMRGGSWAPACSAPPTTRRRRRPVCVRRLRGSPAR